MKHKLYFEYLNDEKVFEQVGSQLCGMCNLARRNPASDIGESYCHCGFDWSDDSCYYAHMADYWLERLHYHDDCIRNLIGDDGR